jgi:excisionase family DNA binding protein
MRLEEAMREDNLLTTKEVAKYLHVVQLTVYRMIDRGDLQAVKVGSVWRIRWTDLQDYLSRSTVNGRRSEGP